jgi:hypothetical protein
LVSISSRTKPTVPDEPRYWSTPAPGVTAADVIDSAQYGAASAGLRRLGVVTYLTGIAFGLATIIEVLRFQALRIREVATAHGHTH